MGRTGEIIGGAALIAGALTVAPFFAGGIFGAAALPIIGSHLGTVLFGIGATLMSRGLTSRPRPTAGSGIAVTPPSESAPVSVIYGEALVAGRIVDWRESMTDSRILYIVVAFGVGSENGDGVESIEQLFIDDRSAVTWIGGVPVVDNAFATLLGVSWHDGAAAQGYDAVLHAEAPTEWPTTSKGAGVAYLALALTWKDGVWGGAPQKITARIKGRKVYDPRDATWKWSSNPALCLRDYLTSSMVGWGLSSGDMNDTAWGAIANHCDELVSVAGTSGTQVRYTCDGPLAGSVGENTAALLNSFRGRLIPDGGKVGVSVRRTATPVSYALDETTIVGSWKLTRAGSRSAPNRARFTWVNPTQRGTPAENFWPRPGDTNGMLADDNGWDNTAFLDLPLTTDQYRAEQIAMQNVREGRADVRFELTAQESALVLAVDDLVKLSIPTPAWTDKLFWVDAIAPTTDGKVRLLLQEYDATAYSLDPQYTFESVPGTNLPSPFSCAPPTDLTATSDASTALATQDGQFVPRILLGWTASPDPFLNHYELAFAGGIPQPSPKKEDVEAWIWPVTDGVSYTVSLRAVNTVGAKSDWASATTVASTKPGLPKDVDIVLSIAFYSLDAKLTVSRPNPLLYHYNIKSVKYLTSTTAIPDVAAVRAETAVDFSGADPSFTVDLGDQTSGATVYAGALGYSDVGGGGREGRFSFTQSTMAVPNVTVSGRVEADGHAYLDVARLDATYNSFTWGVGFNMLSSFAAGLVGPVVEWGSGVNLVTTVDLGIMPAGSDLIASVFPYTEVAGGGTVGPWASCEIKYVQPDGPSFASISAVPGSTTGIPGGGGGAYASTVPNADFTIIVADPHGESGGALACWTNKTSYSSADMANAPDDTVAIPAFSGTATVGPADSAALDEVPRASRQQKTVHFRYTSALTGLTCTQSVVVPLYNIKLEDDGKFSSGSIDDPNFFASTVHPPVVVSSLPSLPNATYPTGCLVVLSTDGKIYRNVSGAWTKAVDGGDLTVRSVAADRVVANSLTAAELASLTGGGLTINLQATGTTHVLDHSAFWLDASGNAHFGGVVAASSFTATAANFNAIDCTTLVANGSGGSPGTVEVFDMSTGHSATVAMDASGLMSLSSSGGGVVSAAYYTTSERRLKKYIKPLRDSALRLLSALRIVTFRRRDEKHGYVHTGIIADDSPAWATGPAGKAFDTASVLAVAVAAIQELQARVEELEGRHARQ